MDSILRILSCALIFSFVKICNTFETASFYGGSYITIPLQDARSTTEIQLRFRTKQADAVLFLAAGKTDYCLIRLEAGRLKVQINLGAGEPQLPAPKGLRLDDLVWHQIALNRKDGEINVTIDKIHVIKGKLPGRYFELNIYDGLFLGGTDYNLDIFLGHFDWLRGCLAAVFYNGVDVLKRARSRSQQSDAHGVTWSCASEFDAGFSSEISFMEEGAYVSLPNPVSRNGVRWQFEMKTISENCILFYNSKSATGGRTDFLGLEIANGKLRLIMDTGNGMTEAVNDAVVVDGEWHLVNVQISATVFEITVDGKFVGSSRVMPRQGNKHLDLSENVYVGGLELNKRANALAVGMKSADKSFIGCLRNMEADGKLLGFPNAKVTQGLLPNCVWFFACSKSTCNPGRSCSQYGVDSFHCECEKSTCPDSDNGTSKYSPLPKTSLPIALEILHLNSVHVMEGENVVITTDNINLILDHAKYGIRDAGVTFYVNQPPHHGSIKVGSTDTVIGAVDYNSVFTLLDLSSEKVRYVHDGSENYNDSVIMELEFTASVGYTLPVYLQGKMAFLLRVEIAPVNDAPFLFIPSTKILRLAEGTRRVITTDLLNASDSDNNNAELVYSVLNPPGSTNVGYVAKRESPGIPITLFTQEDVDQGKIVYVHNGNSTGDDKIILQVSDGVLSSSVSYLKLSIFELQLRLINNSGITVAEKSSALITTSNLLFETNADDPFLSVKYEIVDFPKYGEVQCLIRVKNNQEVWQKVSSFTGLHISREELRYINNEETISSTDSFKFKVSVKSLILPTIYEFRITFVQLTLRMAENKTVQLTENQIAVVKENNLKAVTEPLPSNSSFIIYTLLQEPKVSHLMLGDRPLLKNSTWSQRDIYDNKLAFHLHRKTFSAVDDYIIFSVSAPQCETLEKLFLYFQFQPTDEQKNSVQIAIKPVQVPEGGQQPLLLEHLNVQKENISSVVYQVLEGPAHGWLDMYDVDHTSIEKRNVTQFVNTDIMKQKVTYTHDDSESVSDVIHFLAFGGHGENFQYVTELHFEILLKNDNPPYCVVNNGLNVVVGGDKIMSERNLLYADADIDAKPETISYTRRAIPYGSFTLSDAPYNQLFEFSQNDINSGRVMFRHNGPLSGNITMWVSDGNSYSEFSFEIVASAPYIKVTNNSKLLLRQGGEIVFTTGNLYSSTNVNVPPQLIRYKVLQGPEVGKLFLKGKPNAVEVFTQDDIEKKALIYRHTGDIKSVKDKFTFEVGVQDVYVEDDFQIRLFPAVYWEPLVLVNNRTQYVDEASDVLITRDDLLVQQAHVPPSDITYFVVEQPKYGYLEIEVNGHFLEVDFNFLFHPNSSDESKETAITFFDQGTVDAEKLHYIQVILNQTYDRVVLDATNGIVWLRNIVMNFVIIPEQLFLSGGELRVEEGDAVRLTSALFSVYSPYYAEKVSEYKVKKFPQHGWLQHVGAVSKAANISRWTANQLSNKQIQYIHDGSETVNDSMLIVAYAGEKESVPTKVNIVVSPVNDEIPVLVNNTGASVWRGGICNVNSSNLAVADRDTPNTNLTYVVISAQAGYLAYFSNLNATVDKFTQSEIDSGKITFVHSGEAADGEFDMVVKDGKHTTEPITFKVKILSPSLHLVKQADFQIFPLLRKAITPHHLLTWCSDTDKNIFYVVKTPPKYGLLTMVDSDLTSTLSNFSQADVNASRVWYQHTDHNADKTVSRDSFRFDVIASYAAPILDEVFDIKIAVSSGGLDGMLDVETYEVDEGGEVKLLVNTSNLLGFLSSENIGLRTPSLRASVAQWPRYGALCVRDDCSVTASRWFTDDEMNSGLLVYRHDDSDSRFDNLTLTLFLEQDNISLCNVTVNVAVRPKNDQEFRLVQDSPNLSIVQGERLALTRDQLLTIDKDTYPEEIVYDVISGPTVGALYVNEVRGAGRFTQADVNAGKVVYEHSGPVQSSSFHFRVSDGHFDPKYKVFNIYVHAAKLNVVVSRPVFLKQGKNATTISSSVFNVSTNHKVHQVAYNVTTPPRYGFVVVANAPRHTTFTQADLKAKRVAYVQSDLSMPGDAFEVEATLPATAVGPGAPATPDSKVSSLWVNVSVEPLLKVGHFMPVVGIRNCIDEEVLNADDLANITNSNPSFVVVKNPKYGILRKIIKRNRKGSGSSGGKSTRESRTVKDQNIDRFTYDEVKSKVIYYVAKKSNTSLEDSFAFVLSATMVQPAIGELKFQLVAESSTARAPVTSAKPRTLPPSRPKQPSSSSSDVLLQQQPPRSSENSDVEIASPNMTTDDYYLFVSLLFGVLCVSLVFVVLVRCRSKKRAEEDTKMNPPLPLPRPPDDLLPSSPYPKQRNTLHSTPQCKVIPLGGADSVTSSEHDFNLRYPYGAADEDWSSYDTDGYSTRNNNPVLRKNQYWV